MPSNRAYKRTIEKMAKAQGFERHKTASALGGKHLLFRNAEGLQLTVSSTPKTPEFAITRFRQDLRRVAVMSQNAQQQFIDWIVERYGTPGENVKTDLRIRHVASEFRDETGNRTGIEALIRGANVLDPRFRLARMNGPKAATYEILLAPNGNGPEEPATPEELEDVRTSPAESEEELAQVEEAFEKLDTAVAAYRGASRIEEPMQSSEFLPAQTEAQRQQEPSLDDITSQVLALFEKARTAEESTARADLAAELMNEVAADLAVQIAALSALSAKVNEALEALK